MVTATLVSLETYLTTSYEPDVDYVDGMLEDRNVGEYDHNVVQQAIQIWFYLHGKEWRIRSDPGTENQSRFHQGSHSRCLRLFPRCAYRAGFYQTPVDCHRGFVSRRPAFPH
jgi:hypothetical protein